MLICINIRTISKICFSHFFDHKFLFLIFRCFGLVFLSSNLWPLFSLFCWDIFYGYLLCFFPSKWSGCAILQKKTSQTNIKWKCSRVSIFRIVVSKDYLQLWQYGWWSFQTGDTELERFLPKNQHTQRKLLNFEFWINGELSQSAKIWLSKSIFYVKKLGTIRK